MLNRLHMSAGLIGYLNKSEANKSMINTMKNDKYFSISLLAVMLYCFNLHNKTSINK